MVLIISLYISIPPTHANCELLVFLKSIISSSRVLEFIYKTMELEAVVGLEIM